MANNERKAKAPVGETGGPTPRREFVNRNHVNRPWCRTSEYKPPGSDKVGLGNGNQPSKVVYELPYGLSDVQFKNLSARFPGVAFVQTGIDCHDHPIAHTSYRIVWENVMRKLRPGTLVADVSGNPDHNERFNRMQAKRNSPIHVDTFCKVLSAKDSVRKKTRWGPAIKDGVARWEELTLYDMYRNEDSRARFARYDAFLLNHSLYYYKMDEITRLLALNTDSVMYATLHKLEGHNGTLNCGEQFYEKDLQTGVVRQTNVETGEFYMHPDPAPWFQNFCYADEHGAIAWTINKGCDDTYVVTITSTEKFLVPEDCWKDGKIVHQHEAERIVVSEQAGVEPPPAYTMEKVVIKTHDFVPGLNVSKEKVVLITHPELFSALKSFMINKPRNAKTLADLTAKAHREAGNNTLLGTNKRVKISSEALTEHVFAAWTSGLVLEKALFGAIVANNGDISSVNSNLAGKSLSLGKANALKQAVRVALGVNSIMRSKDSVESVLRHVDDLL
jgi:hypothetical protein